MTTFTKPGIIKLFLLLVCFFILSCQGQDSYEQKKTDERSLLYTKLIDSSLNSEKLQKLYKDYIYVPSCNGKMKSDLSLVLKLDYNQVESPGVMHEQPMYAELLYTDGNKIFWFTGVQGEEKRTNSFTYDNRSIIDHNDVFDKNPNKGKLIYYDNMWYSYLPNEDNTYAFLYKEKKKFILDKDKIWPTNDFFHLSIIAVRNDVCILYGAVPVRLVNRYPSRGTVLLYYNWEKQEIMDRIIFPQTRDYNLFFGKDTDSFNRIYFFWQFDRGEVGKPIAKNLYTMIYDYEKDTLYYLYNKVDIKEPIIARHAILGEDENIYYQLVTDEAYYLYKVEIDWDEPMKETEYNPVFFEQHPDLKELLESYKLEQE